jgi:hypothetical protein
MQGKKTLPVSKKVFADNKQWKFDKSACRAQEDEGCWRIQVVD